MEKESLASCRGLQKELVFNLKLGYNNTCGVEKSFKKEIYYVEICKPVIVTKTIRCIGD
jgi:hypothetical protein